MTTVAIAAIVAFTLAQPLPTGDTVSPSVGRSVQSRTLRVHSASEAISHPAAANSSTSAEEPPENASLTDVEVAAGPGGSFVIQRIEPDSLYDRLGLRVGDVVHDLEALTELEFPRSLENAARNSEIRLAVYRDGSLTVLATTAGD